MEPSREELRANVDESLMNEDKAGKNYRDQDDYIEGMYTVNPDACVGAIFLREDESWEAEYRVLKQEFLRVIKYEVPARDRNKVEIDEDSDMDECIENLPSGFLEGSSDAWDLDTKKVGKRGPVKEYKEHIRETVEEALDEEEGTEIFMNYKSPAKLAEDITDATKILEPYYDRGFVVDDSFMRD